MSKETIDSIATKLITILTELAFDGDEDEEDFYGGDEDEFDDGDDLNDELQEIKQLEQDLQISIGLLYGDILKSHKELALNSAQ